MTERATGPVLLAALAVLAGAATADPALAQQPVAAQPTGDDPSIFRDQRRPLPPRAAAPKASASPGAVSAPGPAPVAAPVVATPAAGKDAVATCAPPTIATEAMAHGRMRLEVKSACRAGQRLRLEYGGADLAFTLGADGRLETTLDCFAGAASPAMLKLRDGTAIEVPIAAKDLDRVSKMAVLWRQPVDLDLHAYERTARQGEAGHVWAGAPATPTAANPPADAKGQGFLGSQADGRAAGGKAPGDRSESDKLEVYTYLHAPAESRGMVEFALDYAGRGERAAGAACGTGAEAEVAFQVVARTPAGQIERRQGLFAAVACGAAIPPEARFDTGVLPRLRLGQ